MTTINPYVTFDGKCEEAFNFYKSVFGGNFQFIGKFKDMPESPDYKVLDSEKDKIMHVSLPIGGDTQLFGSDTSKAFGQNAVEGNNFSISINSDSVDEATRLFDGLSDGGIVKMPLNKTFWGSYFGMFTDKYGIHWMVNHELEELKEFEQRNN